MLKNGLKIAGAVLLIFLFAKVCSQSENTTSSNVPRATDRPSTPSTSQSVSRPSATKDYVQEWSQTIDNNRTRLRSMESDLTAIDYRIERLASAIKSAEARLAQLRRSYESVESEAVLLEYNQLYDRYSKDIEEHKSKVEERNSLYNTYKSLWTSTNNLINAYNEAIR